ncbi:MAG TPA: DUF748 domain-containing protein [Phenylobacterium sp.]|jgi:hypothetical protein
MAQALDIRSADIGRPQAHASRSWNWLALPLWIALAVAALVGLYAAAGFWLAPKIIRAQVVSQVAERYHRTASIGPVTFNPFTFRLQADRFRLPDADGKPMIGFERLTVAPSISSLWRGGVTFREIALEAPRIRLVRRPNGRLNIQDLVPPKHLPEKPPPSVFIDHLTINRGVTDVLDLDRPQPFAKTFSPVSFTLNNFATRKQGANYVLTATSERNEGLAWRGTFGLDPLVSRGTFSLARVKAPPLAELAGPALPFGVTSGDIDVAGGYNFALRGQDLTLQVNVGSLNLTNVGLRARGADADWITLPKVAASNLRFDVPARTAAIGRIEATAPSVTAWTVGTGINLARYGGPPPGSARPQAATPPPGAAGPPWKVDLPDLRIRGAKVVFEERSLPTPLRVTATPLDVTISDFALPTVRPIQFEASTGLVGGGRLAAKGPVTLGQALSADLDIAASDIGLPRFQPYIEKTADLRLLSGRASAKGHLRYAVKGGAKYDGTARVDALHTTDKVLREDFINWRSLRLEGVSLRTEPLSVKVRHVAALEPYARVVIGPNYVMNITTVLNPKAAAAQAAARAAPPPVVQKAKFSLFSRAKHAPPPPPRPAEPPRKALPVEIALVTVENGEMDFSDLSIQPNFRAGIKQLNGTIKGLSGRQDARAAVDMAGQVDAFSPVKIDGQVNYFAARSFTDVSMTFRNVEMTTLSPYSGKFGGYKINRGKLNVDLHYNIDDQKLHANHKVVINQLQLGEKVASADAVKLPVKLIVALLKDKNGVINVPIEIRGTLDDPKFQVWPVIWQVVRNMMGKIAEAPFKLLGGLLGGGGGGDDLQYIAFAPGTATLDEAGRQKIAAVAKALAERPSVNLEAPMAVNPAVDRPAMIEARLDARLAAVAAEHGGKAPAKPAAETAATDPKARRAALEDLYRREFGAKPEIPKPAAGADKPKDKSGDDKAANAWMEDKLRARITVTDADLQQLGRQRAQAVMAVLVSEGQVDASRVFITAQAAPGKAAPEKASPGKAAAEAPADAKPDAKSVRMELSLS